ncbi:MAG TPA: hypothetical protein VGK64_03700 [Bryobacteraceae bacterium]
MTARSIRRALERKQKKLARKAERQNEFLESATAAAPATSVLPSPMGICFASGDEEETEIETAVSPARLAANQRNALLSSGPKTTAGKAKSSLNAVKTGLTGRTVLLPTDDAAAYERHIAAFERELRPVGPQESALVHSLAAIAWRLDRIPALEMSIYAQGRAEFADLFEEHEPALRPGLIDLHTHMAYEKQLRNLQMQEARLVRRREKETAELRRLQEERKQNERRELDTASKLYLAAKVAGKPFDPTEHGFEFSIPQIERFLAQQPPRPVAISAGN